MGALRSFIAAVALIAASPAQADSVEQWHGFITEASLRFGIPEGWIIRVMRAESGGKTRLKGRPITSHAGAMGLMQLMPGTWAPLRARLNLGNNPHDPHDNIIAGTAYLRMMYDQFGYPGLFGAYNAGPGRYAAYLRGQSRLPTETIAYMASVGAARPQPEFAVQIAKQRTANALFYTVRGTQEMASAAEPKPTSNGLFITLNTLSGSER
jgi:soluble lytic murein transglycosylase-like protein